MAAMGKLTLTEREDDCLLNGKEYANLPQDSNDQWKDEGWQTFEQAQQELQGECGAEDETSEGIYLAKQKEEMNRKIQGIEAQNRWKVLEDSSPAHDIAQIRAFDTDLSNGLKMREQRNGWSQQAGAQELLQDFEIGDIKMEEQNRWSKVPKSNMQVGTQERDLKKDINVGNSKGPLKLNGNAKQIVSSSSENEDVGLGGRTFEDFEKQGGSKCGSNHERLIKVDGMTKKDLPGQLQIFWNLIPLLISLTVKTKSLINEPDCLFGSGFILDASKGKDDDEKDCLFIDVSATCHSIFNENSKDIILTADFCYASINGQAIKVEKVIILTCVDVCSRDDSVDRCVLKFVCYDKWLRKKLPELIKEYNSTRKKLDKDLNLGLSVSYPHNCDNKYLSFGKFYKVVFDLTSSTDSKKLTKEFGYLSVTWEVIYTARTKLNSKEGKVIFNKGTEFDMNTVHNLMTLDHLLPFVEYDITTCEGSSGAPVILLCIALNDISFTHSGVKIKNIQRTGCSCSSSQAVCFSW